MMSTTSLEQSVVSTTRVERRLVTGTVFSLPSILVISCALLTSLSPVGTSIAIVFLFAGPHNWFEARYFLCRMPARWGSLWPYFVLGIIGTITLAVSFASLPWFSGDDPVAAVTSIAIWNSALMIWITCLASMRQGQNPRRHWSLLIPGSLLLMAINWMWPLALSLSLVYLHPIVSIVFLDQELKRRRSTWRRSFHCAMAMIPVALIGMGCLLINVVDLPEDDVLTWQIAQHAGGSILQNVSTHFLVAAHVFLELIHYVVWIVLLPALDQRPFDWSLSESPLGRRSLRWRILFSVLAMAGGLVMAILWGAFLSDYSATRSVYFTVAILHVLAEIPFLLRSL